jgi:hypothetical protein
MATDSQKQAWELTFAVILADAHAARFTNINTGAHGAGNCMINKHLPNAIPPNMHYIGVGTQSWDLGTEGGAGAVPVNTLACHIDSLSVNPPQVQLSYAGSLTDASQKTPMFLEWGAALIAFGPTEMAQSPGPMFPQYTTVAQGLSAPAEWTNHATNQTGPIQGFLDAFDGVTYTYPQEWNTNSGA